MLSFPNNDVLDISSQRFDEGDRLVPKRPNETSVTESPRATIFAFSFGTDSLSTPTQQSFGAVSHFNPRIVAHTPRTTKRIEAELDSPFRYLRGSLAIPATPRQNRLCDAPLCDY